MAIVEDKVEVKSYRVTSKKECVIDGCSGYSTYVNDGLALTSFPTQFNHKCDTCHNRTTEVQRYPLVEIKFEEVE